jgi:hypothetical protein
MPKKRFSAEQIVTLLRQIEVSIAQGKPTPVTCRAAGISLQGVFGTLRCVDRCCLRTWQARRSETPNSAFT